MSSMPKFNFSLVGSHRAAPGVWCLYMDSRYFPRVRTLNGGLAKLRKYVAATNTRRATLWVRTQEAAVPLNVSPVVWCGRSGGPGHGAVCIGTIKMSDMMDTIEAHARMM